MGFRREAVIGLNGERMSIYYVTPDGKVKIPSKSAMGRHLRNNPMEGLSVNDYKPIILDINYPERETVRMAGSRHSIARSTPQMGASPQLAYSDDSARTANTTRDKMTCRRALTIKVEKGFFVKPLNFWIFVHVRYVDIQSIVHRDKNPKIIRYLFVKKKVFNYSDLHFSEGTFYKIRTLVI